MDELGHRLIVPRFAYTAFYKVRVISAESLDSEQKGQAVHFRVGNSEGDILEGPYSLL